MTVTSGWVSPELAIERLPQPCLRTDHAATGDNVARHDPPINEAVDEPCELLSRPAQYTSTARQDPSSAARKTWPAWLPQ